MPQKKQEKKSNIKTGLQRNPALYRAKLDCQIARETLAGDIQPPSGLSRQDWALYNICHAIEDIATALMNQFSPAETIDK